MSTSNDTGFTGSIPEIYESYLVPMLFEPYARDLGSRLGSINVMFTVPFAPLERLRPSDGAISALVAEYVADRAMPGRS